MEKTNRDEKHRGRPGMSMEKPKATGFFLYPETREKLSILFQKTRIPKAVFVRDALEDLFKKYDSILNRVDGDGIILKNCG